MDGKEIWEETVRQMSESPEFQDAGVMYAQGEIDRLQAENEKLEAAFLAEHQAAVDQFGIAEDLRAENERLQTKLDDMRRLMDRKRSVRCGLCGQFDCTTDHDKPTYLR